MALKKQRKLKAKASKDDFDEWFERHKHVFRFYNAVHRYAKEHGRLECGEALTMNLSQLLISKGVITEKEWHEYAIAHLFPGKDVRIGNRPDDTQVCCQCKGTYYFHNMHDAKENPFTKAVCQKCHDEGF